MKQNKQKVVMAGLITLLVISTTTIISTSNNIMPLKTEQQYSVTTYSLNLGEYI